MTRIIQHDKIKNVQRIELLIGGENMSFNYSKLRGKIVEKFGTQGCFAKELGVSERTLSLKLNNRIFFSQDEIAKMSDLLNINPNEIQDYFFEKEVQNIEL